jgi:hypothetical protein
MRKSEKKPREQKRKAKKIKVRKMTVNDLDASRGVKGGAVPKTTKAGGCY